MVDQNTFLETLNSVKEIIATAETPMKEDEILKYFADMELDGSQKAMVIDYLMNPDTYKEEQSESQQSEEENKPETTNENPNVFEDHTEQVNVYQMYLSELEGLENYSLDEMDEFYKKLLQGDDSVIEKISNVWLKRVTDIANQYMDPRLLLEDLVQEGNMALFLELTRLCGSMEKCDVEESLMKAIETGIMNYASELRDEKELEDSIVGKVNLVNAARSILTEENGKVPTIKELADYTKMSEQELEGLQEMIEEANKE